MEPSFLANTISWSVNNHSIPEFALKDDWNPLYNYHQRSVSKNSTKCVSAWVMEAVTSAISWSLFRRVLLQARTACGFQLGQSIQDSLARLLRQGAQHMALALQGSCRARSLRAPQLPPRCAMHNGVHL